MPCNLVKLQTGETAFVCTSGRRKRCACGKPATLECDWKVKDRRSGTCDRPICAACTTKPAEGKDLCREHATAWKAWEGAR